MNRLPISSAVFGLFLDWLVRQDACDMDYLGSLREMKEFAVLRSRQ